MADIQKIAVRPRAVTGKRVSRLRREGVLPGVVFGGHKDSANVQTDLREFERGYRRWGNTTLVTLEGMTEGEQPALIHDVTRSTLNGKLLHGMPTNPAAICSRNRRHGFVSRRKVEAQCIDQTG